VADREVDPRIAQVGEEPELVGMVGGRDREGLEVRGEQGVAGAAGWAGAAGLSRLSTAGLSAVSVMAAV